MTIAIIATTAYPTIGACFVVWAWSNFGRPPQIWKAFAMLLAWPIVIALLS